MPVHVEPDLFAAPGEWDPTPEWYVAITEDPDTAMPALMRAAERMLCTDGMGVEYPNYDAANEGGEWAPPNSVNDPVATPLGIVGYVDCKSAVEPLQAERFRSILQHELEAVGANATVRNMTYDEMMDFLRQQ
jgi:hypothetical protein